MSDTDRILQGTYWEGDLPPWWRGEWDSEKIVNIAQGHAAHNALLQMVGVSPWEHLHTLQTNGNYYNV